MALTMTSYDACTAAGWGPVPRGLAGGCFASGKIFPGFVIYSVNAENILHYSYSVNYSKM